jgi:hypothetical protein
LPLLLLALLGAPAHAQSTESTEAKATKKASPASDESADDGEEAPEEEPVARPPSNANDEFIIPITEEEAQIEVLTTRIRALEEQLDALQAQGAVEADELPIDLETRVNAYADVNLKAFNVNHPPGFEIGDLVLSYSANLDRNVSAVVDVVYGRGQFGDQQAFVDRVNVTFAPSEKFKVSAGKLQSPFGYWNTNIPYGSYLYATSTRPSMLTFERYGAWLTTRQTGIDVHGTFAPGFWQAGYHVGVGNGRSAQLSQTQDIGDGTTYKATWVQLWAQTPGGIQVGFTAAYDPIRQSRQTLDFNQDIGDQSDKLARTENETTNPILSSNVDEIQLHPHIAILRPRMQIIAEGALLSHQSFERQQDGEAAEFSYGGYLQWQHEFGRGTTPYARGEFVEWWKDDPLFIDLRKGKSRIQGTVGVRQEVALHAALKLEGTYINELVYRHPTDDLYIEETDSLYYEGINEFAANRFGIAAQLAVGF